MRLGQKLCQKKPVEVKQAEVASDFVFMPPRKWAGADFLTERENVVPETGTAPCKTACPAHIAVQGYLKMAGEGRYREALALWGHDVTVFEKENVPGGMMVLGMPSFRLDRDVVKAEIDVIRQLGVEIRCGVEVGKDVSLDELRAQGYEGFYVAIV